MSGRRGLLASQAPEQSKAKRERERQREKEKEEEFTIGYGTTWKGTLNRL